MDVTHQATSTKDRTGLFPVNHWFIPSVETGVQLRDWLESGADTSEPQRASTNTPRMSSIEQQDALKSHFGPDGAEDLVSWCNEQAHRAGKSWRISDVSELSESAAASLLKRLEPQEA